VFFVSPDYVVPSDTVVTPEYTTLEAIATLCTSVVAVSAFNSCCTALFNGQHIQQTVDAKVGRQVLQVSTARNFTLSSTFWASYGIMATTRS